MLIEYKNVTISQGDKEVLSEVDFHVDESEFVYIIGKVGSGKSSLLKTIYEELDIDSADKAEVLGRDLMTLKRKEVPALRKEMGIIFQDFQLLSDRSVFNNLKFVLQATGWKNKQKVTERIEHVLEEVGMTDKSNSMPHELSGGEQQRIAIARALLNEPKMIIADEPTGNLDIETADKIVSLLKDITQSGTAVVMSTHNIPMLDKFPGIVYRCKEGKLADVTSEFNNVALADDSEDNSNDKL
jgi:cell division transport system ATP-binding protein